MFHYVFLDPRTIDEAAAAGEMGLGRLIELLQGFRRDVLLAETDGWRVERELGDRVRAIPNRFQHERRQIQDLLIWFKRNGSPVILNCDEDPVLDLAVFAENRAEEAELDLIISPGEIKSVGSKCIRSNLAKCHMTPLNQVRTNFASGRNFEADETNFEGVAILCFRKLVKNAEIVRVYDYALGEYYSNEQPVNLKRFVRFLRDHAKTLRVLEIHTLSKTRNKLENDIHDLRHEVDFAIEIKFYNNRGDLPHARYLGADHRYLDIDRGIDLCDANGRCRLTQIKYADVPSKNGPLPSPAL